MTQPQLKQALDSLTRDERAFAAAYLRHLSRRDTDANRAELSARMAEFDQGRKFSLEQVERMHNALKEEGR